MLISKTTFEKQTMLALQQQLVGKSRNHTNDLVALEYVFDTDVTPQHAVLGDTFIESIYYTFFWAVPFHQLQEYQHSRIQTVIHKTYQDDIPAWCVLFTGTLGAWFDYCGSKDTKFTKFVKKQLTEDGYGRRL